MQVDPIAEKGDKVWRLLLEAGMYVEDILACADTRRDMPTVENWDEIDRTLKEVRIMVAKETRWNEVVR